MKFSQQLAAAVGRKFLTANRQVLLPAFIQPSALCPHPSESCAASLIAARILEDSARFLPAISNAVP